MTDAERKMMEETYLDTFDEFEGMDTEANLCDWEPFEPDPYEMGFDPYSGCYTWDC